MAVRRPSGLTQAWLDRPPHEHALPAVQRLNDESQVALVGGSADERQRLAIRRPVKVALVTRCQAAQACPISSDDLDVRRVAAQEGEELSVARECGASDRGEPEPAKLRPVRARDGQPSPALVRVVVSDCGAIGRNRNGILRAPSRKQGRQTRAVGADAVRARLAVAIACEHDPVTAARSGCARRCRSRHDGDRDGGERHRREPARAREPAHRFPLSSCCTSSARARKTTRPPPSALADE